MVCRLPIGKATGDLHGLAFAHAVDEDVGPGIEENGPPHAVVPVVIVGQPAHAGLDPADDHGYLLEGLAHAVGINDQRPVRPQAGLPARGVIVLLTGSLVGRIVGHHGIHVARGDAEKEPWPPQALEIRDRPPVGLGDDAHPVSTGFQHAADQRHPVGRMIHVGIPGDQDDIEVIPSPLLHVRS